MRILVVVIAPVLALALLAALLVGWRAVAHQPTPASDHAQLCALLGAIMTDSDTTTGLPARAARLYREDCQ